MGAPEWRDALQARAADFWQEDGHIEHLQRLSAGASAETWRFDFVTANARHACIYRRDAVATSNAMSLCIGKSLEFRVVNAALSAGVPVARPLFEHDKGYVMQHLSGETLPRKLLRDERFASARGVLTEQCASALARIHAITPVAGLPVYSAGSQLAELERLYRNYQVSSPVFEVAFKWLRDHLPAVTITTTSVTTPHLTTVVHGDFRNGNLMVDESGLRGVLDWELAHCGDPAEDLGWLCVNAWRFGITSLPVGGFGKREELLDAYARHSGRWITPGQLHYWEVFGTLRWGIICLYQVFSHLHGVQVSLELAAIGRRLAEVEMDLLMLLTPKPIIKELLPDV